MSDIIIREICRSDCKQLKNMIQELAIFEKMPDGPKLSAEDLERYGFCDHPLFYGFVAELNNHELVGYSVYYYTFSTWNGKSMFMDELFVLPSFRNRGIGSQLFNAVVKKAVEVNCARLNFLVLNWNPAVDFYKRKGVNDITETEKWHQYQMDSDAFKRYFEKTNNV